MNSYSPVEARQELLAARDHSTTPEARSEIKRRQARAEQTLQAREFVRHEIQALRHVQDLENMALMLLSGQEAAVDPVTEQPSLIPLDKDRTSQLNVCANIKFRLLAKVLPDIKAVELTGAGGEELGSQRQLAEMELRNRLRAVLTQGKPLELVEELVEDAEPVEETSYECLG
jgi:hypothetical protein